MALKYRVARNHNVPMASVESTRTLEVFEEFHLQFYTMQSTIPSTKNPTQNNLNRYHHFGRWVLPLRNGEWCSNFRLSFASTNLNCADYPQATWHPHSWDQDEPQCHIQWRVVSKIPGRTETLPLTANAHSFVKKPATFLGKRSKRTMYQPSGRNRVLAPKWSRQGTRQTSTGTSR